MFKTEKAKLPALLEKIGEARDLIVPVLRCGQVNFELWERESQADLETLKTSKSPKDVFFPQSETLYSCIRDGKKISVKAEELRDRPFVVFGMKSCDVKALDVLDRVFLDEPADTYYQARREMGTVVSLACREPEETCFCRVFGIDCAEPEGDVAMWMTDESLYWKPLTEKGKALTGLVEDLLTDAGESELDEEKENIRSVCDQLPYMDLSLEGWNPESLQEKFDSPLWEELYRPCLACGTCTFVCPTCQCYDIKDFDTGHGVYRYRCWDSCMYSDFTMMAHGNNRTSQMQRFRQRFMHKLIYYPANYGGMYSCVGCGRCVSKCPSSLNIVKVIKKFAESSGDEGRGGVRP